MAYLFNNSLCDLCFVNSQVDAVKAKCKGTDVDLSEKAITNINECLKVVGAATVHDLGMENGAVCEIRAILTR